MPLIKLTTRIKAPASRVFDLSRSVELHIHSAGKTNEQAIAGRTSGLLELGDEVTWQGSHLKIRHSLRIKIKEMERPLRFSDQMISGAFTHMEHVHLFTEENGVTTMTDEFDYKSPGGPFAWIIENTFLTAFLRRFLADRNRIIKEVAQSKDWKQYLPDETK